MSQFPSPVKSYHTSTYGAIDPSRPDFSQTGRNVIITGAGSGIGQAIALSFAKANASNIALLGRTIETLQETKTCIELTSSITKAYIYKADITEPSSLETAFKSFVTMIGGPVHTLITNAGYSPTAGALADSEVNAFITSFEINAIGTLNTIRAFVPHTATIKDASGYRAQIIHTSTAAVQVDIPSNSGYAVSKLAAAKYVQTFAFENPDFWVVNLHPGIYDTLLTRGSGLRLEAPDEITLPADWTVWAASKGSACVPSGRFLWAHWDVEEIRDLFAQMKRGELKDGELAFGVVPVGQRFKLGLIGGVQL